MSQPPKDPELEKVKTLLRRLEELPQDNVADQIAAGDVVRLAAQAEISAARPRPTLVEPAPSILQQVPLPPPPPIPEAESMPPMEDEAGNGRKVLIIAAFVVACGVGFLLARQSWDAGDARISSRAPSAPTAQPAIPAKDIAPETTPRPAPPPTSGSASSAPTRPDTAAAVEARGPATPSPQPEDKAASPPARIEPAISVESGTLPKTSMDGSTSVALPPSVSTGVMASDARQPSEAAAAAVPPPPRPAAPPRQSLPDADSPDEEAMRTLVKQGQAVLGQGQVAPARLLFRRAADLGSGEAAVLLGDTFDPERLKAMGARGVAGDVQEAIRWYEKADELGAPSAKARLMALSSR